MNIGLLDVARGCAFASRYPVFAEVIPPAGLLDWLRGFNPSSSAPLLVPTSDIWIEAVMQLTLPSATVLRFPAYADMAGALLDKVSFHALCKNHGMETPGVWQARNKEELLALAGKVPLPCIFKPALIHRARGFLRGRKVLLARTEAEFLAHVIGMPEGLGEWLVQEIIPGAESAITLFGGYIDRSGVPRQVFTGRKLRQYPAGFGSASLVASTPCKETESLTLEFLSKIGFRGICGAEFKRDPRDGRLKIIEINPRPTLWFQATHDAGCRILEAAWRDMAGQKQIAEVIPRADLLWRYLFKDMASAQFYRRQHDFIFPAPDVSGAERCMVKSWPVFDIRDPLPALVEPFEFARKALERRT
ncbi:MAG: ATP-grasp domain-containing protein [Anaerolineae bacterium]|nr:ATP-grasp domain-containing protein [Anaerolineae bacterium]